MKVLLVLRQLFLAYVSQNVSQVIHRFAGDTSSAGGSVNLQRVVFSQRLIDGRNTADDTRCRLQGAGYFADHALEAFQVWPAGSYLCAFFAALYQRAAKELYLAPAENLSEGSAK